LVHLRVFKIHTAPPINSVAAVVCFGSWVRSARVSNQGPAQAEAASPSHELKNMHFTKFSISNGLCHDDTHSSQDAIQVQNILNRVVKQKSVL